MLRHRLIVLVLLAVPLPAFAAASKEYVELQREIGQLGDAVKNLQSALDQSVKSQNDKFAALQAQIQPSIETANSLGKAVAAMQSSLQQSVRDVEDKLQPPVAQLSTRVESMSSDFLTLQQAVADMNHVTGEIKTQLSDLNNLLKVLPSPPAPAPAAGGGASSAASPGLPPFTATDMLRTAERDRLAAHYDLALEDYADFMKYYGDTPDSTQALYYTGYIHYLQEDYEAAVNDFDAVAKVPGSNDQVPLARLYKVRSLLKLSHREDAAAEYKDLLKRYPNNRDVRAACDELKSLGSNCAVSRAPAKASSRKK